jgi:hypothetical protein
MQHTSAAYLAMTVAALFVAACEREAQKAPRVEAAIDTEKGMPGPPPAGSVQCLGINECKGNSACHVIGDHGCAGQNTCKGKGWISVPAAECQAKGGKVLDS